MQPRFIFITGGVVSSLGKGITAASIGLLLKSRGFSVINQKFDPYLNIAPGTLNPYQHGEVFITEDGGEADLDLGHYERFTDVPLHKFNTHTAGKIYLSILEQERTGNYHGETVQVIPHVTDEIKNRIMKTAEKTGCEIIITEIGGTVGDIESLPFIEAIRQIRNTVGKAHCVFVHLGLLPYLKECGEMKTKPMQHSVKELLGFGIQPDIIMCRSEKPLTKGIREKLSLFCNVEQDAIIENLTAQSIYEVPLMLEEANLGRKICQLFNLPDTKPNLASWKDMIHTLYHLEQEVCIALVGKYTELPDAYLSISEALNAAGIYHKTKIKHVWIDAAKITDEHIAATVLQEAHAIIVPDGFGEHGIQGMLYTAAYARKKGIPYFGICLGMHIAVIEFARNELGLKDANSTEFTNTCECPIIDVLPDHNIRNTGAFRLGSYPCTIEEQTLSKKAYTINTIHERHRHRYALNNDYCNYFEHSDMYIAGKDYEHNVIEIIELKNHPWFVTVQFHPEFTSRPNKPHPLFKDFIRAALLQKEK